MDFEKYTERSRGFIQSAQSLALREGHQRFTPEHLLKVLLDDEEGLAAGLIRAAGGDPRLALKETELALSRQPKVSGGGAGQVYLAPEMARVFDAAQKNPNLRGMGTTIVGCMFVGDYVYVAHVGDSRCYRVSQDGIKQITRDHSLLEDYKDARPDMSEEEARNFPHKNVITRALGMRDTVVVDISKHEIRDGDQFVLCSDGLCGMLDDKTIGRIVREASTLENAVAELIEQANRAGGTDNITAMLIQCNL